MNVTEEDRENEKFISHPKSEVYFFVIVNLISQNIKQISFHYGCDL